MDTMDPFNSKQLTTQFFGGYDKKQVDHLLDSLVSEIHSLNETLTELKAKMHQLAHKEIDLIPADEVTYQDLIYCEFDSLLLIRPEVSQDTLIYALADQDHPEIHTVLSSMVSKREYEEILEHIMSMDQSINQQQIYQAQQDILSVLKRLCHEKHISIYKPVHKE